MYLLHLFQFFRIQEVTFDFTLTSNYQKGVIEQYNAIEVEFGINILLMAHNHLHNSRVDVELHLQPKLTRCDVKLRVASTIIDVVVILVAILATVAYSLSIIRAVRLTKVCYCSVLSIHDRVWYVTMVVKCMYMHG